MSSAPEYTLFARTVDGQDIELCGVRVHIEELNGLTLFRVPPETTDKQIYALKDMLAEAFKDMDSSKIIVARGGFDLRLERIEVRPATPKEQLAWLEEKIRDLCKERDELFREIYGQDSISVPVKGLVGARIEEIKFERSDAPILQSGWSTPAYLQNKASATTSFRIGDKRYTMDLNTGRLLEIEYDDFIKQEMEPWADVGEVEDSEDGE